MKATIETFMPIITEIKLRLLLRTPYIKHTTFVYYCKFEILYILLTDLAQHRVPGVLIAITFSVHIKWKKSSSYLTFSYRNCGEIIGLLFSYIGITIKYYLLWRKGFKFTEAKISGKTICVKLDRKIELEDFHRKPFIVS